MMHTNQPDIYNQRTTLSVVKVRNHGQSRSAFPCAFAIYGWLFVQACLGGTTVGPNKAGLLYCLTLLQKTVQRPLHAPHLIVDLFSTLLYFLVTKVSKNFCEEVRKNNASQLVLRYKMEA